MIVENINLLDFAIYLGSGCVYLTMAVCLLTVRVVSAVTIPAYEHARRLLAYCALLNVLIDAATVGLQLYGGNYLLLDNFYVPLLFHVQVYLMCFSILSLIRSRWIADRRRFLFLLPLVLLAVAYVGSYLWIEGWKVCVDGYIRFVSTEVARAITLLLYFVITASVAFSIFGLWYETNVFRNKIESYFSNRQVLKGMRLNYIVYIFIAYLVLADIDFLLCNVRVSRVLTLANILLFVFLVIVIFNIQSLFTQMSVAVDFLQDAQVSSVSRPVADLMDRPEARSDSQVGADEEPRQKPPKDTNAGYMEELVRQWTEKPGKPYMAEGITLADTAREMGIHARLLSHFINDVYGVNFNTWINRLRIREVCRILDTDSHTTMADLAQKAGFTDASAMSKVFRREVGVTPTQYRSRMSHKS